ncbi:hypothetical protein CK507_01245 [Pseudomonas sp. WN033]|nr:hypothetical protein CK507_01245 [Pseudomonas sp. WN033]
MTEIKNALPVGTELDGKYLLSEVLGVGGFGIVYKARHRVLETIVAIKEYLPLELAVRDGQSICAASSRVSEDYELGLQRFVQEARQLVRLAGHPNIVSCIDFFEANGTAYLVMSYEEGVPLSELLAMHEERGSALSREQLLELLESVLSGLLYVHQRNVWHRDLKPANIFIRRADSQPVLLDFGAAKQVFSNNSISVAAFTPGYAAPEQLMDQGNLGPWTDIYAIGAVIWRILYRAHPPRTEMRLSATLRGQPDPIAVPPSPVAADACDALLTLMHDCMALDEARRPQSVQVLLKVVQSLRLSPVPDMPAENPEPQHQDTPAQHPEPDAQPESPAPIAAGHWYRRIGIAAVLLAAVGTLMAFWLQSPDAGGPRTELRAEQRPGGNSGSATDEASSDDQASCQELSLERNRLYKQHGYCFRTDQLITLLGNEGCTQSDSELVFNTLFSDAERSQVLNLLARERAMGCR